MTIYQFSDWFLALFFSFVAVFYFVLIRKRRPLSPANRVVFMGERFSTHWWNHLVFRTFRLLIWGVCVSRLFIPEVDSIIGLVSNFRTPLHLLIGMGFMIAGFALVISVDMKNERLWRSGVDHAGPSKLLTTGLYSVSRNPAFVGVAMGQIGFAFALPSVFSVLCLVIGLIALRVQTMLEEQHLTSIFPDEYSDYRTHVNRWLGKK